MYICICNAVTDREIRACVQNGARSVSDLKCSLGVGTCCGKCAPAAKALIAETREEVKTMKRATSACTHHSLPGGAMPFAA